jgi:hypothetical protein
MSSQAVNQAFADGYQAALTDLAMKNDEAGVHGMFEWIADNIRDERIRETFRRLLPEGQYR